MPEYDPGPHPLGPLCEQWLCKIKAAQERKEQEFGCFAKEAMQFYDGLHDFMWKPMYAERATTGGFLGEDAILPTFRMTVNRVFEAVAIFGPVLYHRNPQVLVTPRQAPEIGPEALGASDPNTPEGMAVQQVYQMLQERERIRTVNRHAQASVMQHYLNWLQYESDKKTEARQAIDEAIIKGLGLLWQEVYQPPGSRIRYPKSFYDSVDNLVVDPDAERWEDIKWVARKCIHPIWEVEREYGLAPGSLKGHYQSIDAQGNLYGSSKETSTRKKYEQTFDLLEYWKVYSKAGFGDRLKPKDRNLPYTPLPVEQFGEFCYIVVADKVPYPLNMPSDVLGADPQELFERAQWPIPFYTDGGWPFAALSFYNKPNSVWPISLIKPAIGELRFVNWCMSFLADKVCAGSSTMVGVMKAAAEDIRKQLADQNGAFKIIELESILGKERIDELISFLDSPKFDVQVWNMCAQVLEMIDKRTGLTELAYGMTGSQLRSAAEAEIKDQNLNVRPDHMANQVEDFVSESSVKEIQAARWVTEGADVLPVLGELGAYVWETQILTSDVDSVVRDFDHRIEAGSARKPNKNNRIRQLNELGQVALPTIQSFALQGAVDPWNAYITDVCKSLDLDPTAYLIRLPPPPDPSQQPPSPEEVKAQTEQQKMQMEQQKLQMEMQLKQADLQIRQQELELKRQEMATKLQFEQQKNAMELQAQEERIEQERRMAQIKMQSEKEQSQLKLETQEEQSEAQIATTKANAKAQMEVTKAKAQAQKKAAKQPPKSGGGKS